jgi:mannosyl-3-phosphoglycerate phosphatase
MSVAQGWRHDLRMPAPQLYQHVRVAVVASLDGGPFDPYLGTPDAADEIWQMLQRAGVPVVFFSSRTRAELDAIEQQLGVRYPFVAEDCGAFYAPRGYFGSAIRGSTEIAGHEAVGFGKPHQDVLAMLRKAARYTGVEIVTFSDMSVNEVAGECGLTLLQARLAKLRDHSEFVRVVGNDRAASTRFARALRSARLWCAEGERFMRVAAHVDTAAVADLVVGLFHESFPGVQVIGIADPIVPAALLQRVDLQLDDASAPGRAGKITEVLTSTKASAESRTDALVSLSQLVRRIALSGRPAGV